MGAKIEKDGDNTGQHQPQNKKIQRKTRQQVNHNLATSDNAGTENTTHSGPNDIDMDVAGTAFYEWQVEL